MKKCPFCAEDIQTEAIKCKHCGEFLDDRFRKTAVANELPWYFKSHFLILAFLGTGPFALPLIWRHPRIKKEFKIIITVVVLVVSFLLFSAITQAVANVNQYLNMLNRL